MQTNFIRILFIFFAIFVGTVGLLIRCTEPYLPVFITRTYCYGKHSVKELHPIVEKLEVPKR